MTARSLLASAALCACALVGGCNKPTQDPAEAAYGRAVAQFAALSAETKDLTYRDARFDQVLEALDQVPTGSEASDRARSLAQRMRLARAAADQADRRSQQELKEATASPVFVPGARAAAPEPVPLTAEAKSAAGTQVRTAALSAPGVPAAQGPSALPEWYRQSGYAPPAPAEQQAAPSTEQQDVDQAQAAGKPDASARPPAPAGSTSDAGWRVYGLPGPAGKAMGAWPQ